MTFFMDPCFQALDREINVAPSDKRRKETVNIEAMFQIYEQSSFMHSAVLK